MKRNKEYHPRLERNRPRKNIPTRVPNHRLIHCQVYDVDVLASVTRTVRVRAESAEQAAELAVARTNERTAALTNWNAKLTEAKVGAVTQAQEPQ